jgi:hypothetical protein
MASPVVGDAREAARAQGEGVSILSPNRDFSMSKAAYEIRALGSVPAGMLDDFEGVTVVNDPAGSTIHVHLADEAELHGLLDALRRGGFLLVDVRRDPIYDLGEESSAYEIPPEDPSATG